MSIIAGYIVPHPPLILPEVGRGEEQKIAATTDAYRTVAQEIRAIAPDVVVVLSPHATAYQDYFHISPGEGASGDMRAFRAPNAAFSVAYDMPLAQAIAREADALHVPAGTLGQRDARLDHGMMVPLSFLGDIDCKFVRIGLSGLSPVMHYRFGMAIARAVNTCNRRAIVVASGDLSHRLKPDGPYGFKPEGPAFDARVTDDMARGDFLDMLTMPANLSEAAGECGLRAFWILAGALDGCAVAPKLLSYEGTFGVGYGVASFHVTGADEARRFEDAYARAARAERDQTKAGESPIVGLARESLETYVRLGKRLALADARTDVPEAFLHHRAGAFVSIKIGGQLRGCIGTISATTDCVASEVLRNAVAACAEDPRFPPVTEEELDELTYSVDVLGAAEPIDSEDMLDPARYGVIVTAGRRRGLLLPMLDGVDTVAEQVAIARRKAGIPDGAKVALERFEVVRYT